jgi:4-hydroxy-tetrahydrodipicolinate synthase
MHSAPARTGTALRPATAFVNGHVPDIAGFWDASGDLEGSAAVGVQCRRSPHGRPRLWAGDEFFLLPGLAAGAYGLVSALAQVAGPAVRDLLNAWLAGDMELAWRLQVELVPLIQILDLVRGDPAPIKTVLEPLGVVGRRHRAPVAALAPARAEAVRSAVREAAAQLGSAAPC